MVPRPRRASALVVAALVVTGLTGTSNINVNAESPTIAPRIEEPNIDELEPFDAEPEPEAAAPDLAIDRWTGVVGQSLGDVAPGAEPTETVEQVGGFESPINVDNDYAIRLRTLLTPEVSGTYRFWISGDDDMRLFVDTTGDDPASAKRVAYIAGWTTYRQWNRFWSQRSAWVELEAGTSYYVEAIGKEGSGDDHFSVAWELDDGFDREVIPARVLEATQLGSGGWRASTPVGLPDIPAAMVDPRWSSAVGPATAVVGWAAVEGADWYEVRLEGAGESRDIVTDEPAVAFDNLVPDTRYLVEVAPASAAGRQPETGHVVVTASGPYPTPIAPAEGDVPTIAYDHWDVGWWTLTSVPAGLAPESVTTIATGLEVPPMRGTNHASRLRAVVTPTRTDVYTFHLSGDDDARLLFNADGPWAHGAVPVAYVSGWTEQYQWDRYQSQSTSAYELVAGESYYIEAMGVHGLGLDHLEVGWSTPTTPVEVVPVEVLSPTMSGAGGWRQNTDALKVAPGPVRNVSHAWITDTSATLEWDAPLVTDEFGAAAHYVATLVDSSSSQAVTETGVTFDGLAPGTEYTIEIKAINDIGTGPAVAHAILKIVTETTTPDTTTPETTVPETTTPDTTTPETTTPDTTTPDTTTPETTSPETTIPETTIPETTVPDTTTTTSTAPPAPPTDTSVPATTIPCDTTIHECDGGTSPDSNHDDHCDAHGNGQGNGHENGVGHTQHGNGNGNGHQCDDDESSHGEHDEVCDGHGHGNGNGIGHEIGVGHTQHGNGNGYGHDGDCEEVIVASGEAPTYVPPEVAEAAKKAGKAVGKGLRR